MICAACVFYVMFYKSLGGLHLGWANKKDMPNTAKITIRDKISAGYLFYYYLIIINLKT